jgi:hypothetical protein
MRFYKERKRNFRRRRTETIPTAPTAEGFQKAGKRQANEK